MRKFNLSIVVACLVACAAGGTAVADEEEAPAEGAKVSYYRDIRPILQENCQGCHQPAKAEGSLDMTSTTSMLVGGDTEEPLYVAGDAEDSLLIDYIVSRDGSPPMMPKGKDPLTEEQVELIRRWIDEGAEDDTPETARETVSMDNPPVYASPPVITSLDYSPDGQLLAVSGYHEVLVHRADGSELVARLVGMSERIESVRFSPDGKLLAATGGSPGRFGEVQIWDVESRAMKHALTFTYDTLYGASWSPDGSLLAFGCADNTLRAIDVASGAQVLYQGAHNDWVLGTAFSTDASHLVSVSRDGSMKLTQVETQQFIDNITSITPGALKGGLISVVRHPTKDELVTGGADGVPKIFQMYRTKERRIGDDFNLIRAFDAVPGRIFCVDFNHDGTQIATASSSDGSGEVRVYQTEDGKLVSRSEGPSPVYAVRFRPDGGQLATGGFDGTVRLRDPGTGEVVKEFIAVPMSEQQVAAAPGE